MRTIATQIQINATAEKVWKILTDLESYSEWNPFIPEAKGSAIKDGLIEVKIAQPDGKVMKFNPRVLEVRENQEFRWIGKLFFNWLFQGEHIFQINSTQPDSVTFEQKENFRGILVPFLWNTLNANTRLGFEAMNKALKERAEEIAVVGG